jgi:MoaA/NifB/PqqE/SkfB family radical SAM enzyme
MEDMRLDVAAQGREPPAASAQQKGGSFCRAAFESLHLSIGGAARPCCEFQGDLGSVKESSVEEIWRAPAFQDLRAKMLRGERDDGCRKCYEAEDAGGRSQRDIRNAGWFASGKSPAMSLSAIPELPLTLDLRFSNLCNLSCRTCGPDASTKWFAEARELGWWKPNANPLVETFISTSAALDALGPTLQTVEAIYFAGGEPLLQEQHYAVLQDLIDRGRTDVRLIYSSNMMVLQSGDWDVPRFWSQFKTVSVMASIDGHKEMGELIREGLSWDRFVTNVVTLRQQCPHVDVSFAITVSVLNVLALPELCRHLQAIEPGREVQFLFNTLQEPRHYSVQILPAELKQEAKQRLENLAADLGAQTDIRASVQPVINYMMATDRSNEVKQYRWNTKLLDSLRDRDSARTIPELALLLVDPPPEKLLPVLAPRFSGLKEWVVAMRRRAALLSPRL